MRIQDRIDGAVARAAARYCGKFTVELTSPQATNGSENTNASGSSLPAAGRTRLTLVAVKRDAAVDAVDSAISSRLYEFVVAPSSAAALVKLTGGTTLNKNLDEIRKIVIREFQNDEQVAEYRVNASRPLAENTPTGGVLRLFAYQTKG